MPSLRARALISLTATAVAVAGFAGAAHAAQYDTTLASSRYATKGGGLSATSTLSADGRYVAFYSQSTNLLVPDDTDAANDVYVRDLAGGTLTLASRASGALGAKGNAASSYPALSGNGRYVAFESTATNLTSDTVTGSQIYVRDLQAQTTRLVSRATGSTGAPGNGGAFAASISADGRYVAFESDATNLSGGDGDSNRDIYVRDLVANTTTLVSVGPSGKSDNISFNPKISADGAHVAFASHASNLVPGVSTAETYERNLAAGTTTLVSRADGADGAPGDGGSDYPSISADGRFVGFQSDAGNLDPAASGGLPEVFVRDLQANTTQLVSRAGSGPAANNNSARAALSADGGYVAFGSTATNLTPDVTSGVTNHVYVRSLSAGSITLASRASGSAGAPGNASSYDPSLSADARFVSFHGTATNLSPDDEDTVNDVFVRDLLGAPTPPAPAAGPQGAQGPAGPQGAQGPQGPAGATRPAVAKLFVLLSEANFSARRARAIAIPYVATAGGSVTLEIRRGTRRLAQLHGTAKTGRNALRWKTPRGLSTGAYKLRLRATGRDGQTAADRAKLTIR